MHFRYIFYYIFKSYILCVTVGWEASGDGTELTTEALAAERVIDSIESRMDDFVVESRIDDDGTFTFNAFKATPTSQH